MRRKLLIGFLLGVIFYTRSLAQSDSVRFAEYVKLIEKYGVNSPKYNADSGYYFATQALRFAQSKNDKYMIAKSYYYQGFSLANVPFSIANKSVGREELHKAARMFKELNKKEDYLLAVKDLYIIESHFFNGKSEKSALYQAITMEGRSDPNFKYPDSLPENTPDKPLTRATNLRIIKAVEKYLQLLENQNKPESIMYAQEILGVYSHHYGEYNKSINYFESAFKLSEKTNNQWFSSIILNGMIPTLLDAKRYEEAEQWTKKGLILVQSQNMPHLRRRFLDFMYQSLKEKGEWNEAVSYKEKSYALYDSLQDEAVLKNAVYMDEKLNAERKQFAAEQTSQIQQQRLNYSLFGGGFLLLIIGGLVWYNAALRQTKKQLETKNAEISEALLRGQTQERKRVASDLHDNLVAKIAGLRWRFQMMDKNELGTKNLKLYEDVEYGLGEALADVRMVSHNLQPMQLEEKGLTEAVKKMVDDINQLGKTHFELFFSEDVPRFMPKVEFELYNVMLELTTNVLRHAQAKNASIVLRELNGTFRMFVKDDGIGMVEKLSDGMGIKNVKNRVAGLGGMMNIQQEEGTKIEIVIPNHALRHT
jgi:signal transduction histidine kinase